MSPKDNKPKKPGKPSVSLLPCFYFIELLKPVLVFMFAIAAALASLTQVTQYRSHPVDVYTGFAIGAGIAVYLALYAVGNFKPSLEPSPQILKKPPPPQKDALHALTQRGHDSVYQKTHASESNDELAAPVDVTGINRKVRREKASMGSLKRASADVELLAPRNPMGKETMLTFSNTLPRASANANGTEEPAQRHMTFHVPSSKQLVSEWKQKSLEMRTLSLREDGQQGSSIDVVEETNEESKENLDMDLPTAPYPSVQSSVSVANRVPIPQRPGAPQLVHIPEEVSKPPPVSPKSAMTRAKWLSMKEKGPVPAATPEPPRLPNKQLTSTPKSSDTASSCATSSNASSTESPYFRLPSERDSCSIVTVDAHAPHHPIVRLSSVSSNTWDWRSNTNGSTEVQETSRTMPRKEYRAKTDYVGSEPSPHPDLVPQFHRKPSIPAKEWDPGQPHPEPDHFFKKLQLEQRFRDL
ncbi:Phospholipid phosphatase-related protein type 3 [Bagarius yarrelli]|uniref:Phospholipid phosphatase-related protein type 3 n=1 Tax=Bagarius yarrelli TaxID=175774 RepID=A0A556VX93_BAGYA|nr:Phospholipid phosphatase-related protein type 3 [Bagarius yarrelli]